MEFTHTTGSSGTTSRNLPGYIEQIHGRGICGNDLERFSRCCLAICLENLKQALAPVPNKH